ncbi:hypothetical protein AZE42_05642 [Rhizopogon vesiculosus]|uniref:Helicase ATP-binding domain-containing protein n=1 Tax=Rhizopogon vesiculosus TaxID=180088 RepID=A0A1J8Q5Z5_9AGAM|nr:hypothetical protein AZE42_05642 [Rhizopogon vesiculosus]
MTHTILSLQQDVYVATHDPIVVEDIHESIISPAVLNRFLSSAQGGTVGMAATYRSDCSLSSLAFATLTCGLVVHFSAPEKPNRRKNKKKGRERQSPIFPGRASLQDHILCNPSIQLYGYMMDRISVSLFLDLSLRINAVVDILSVSPKDDRHSLQAIMNALGGDELLQKINVKTLFARRTRKNAPTTKDVALQAWAAYRAATLARMAPKYAALSRIATDTMPDVYLSALAKISRDAEIIESLKPTTVTHDVKEHFTYKDGNLNLESTRFKTRVMRSRNQVIRVKAQVGDRQPTIIGQATVNGRMAQIGVEGPIHSSGTVLSVTTVGVAALTSAEKFKEYIVLEALQGLDTLPEHPFFCNIWVQSPSTSWLPPVQSIQFVYYPGDTLNDSQYLAVQRILSGKDKDRVLLIHGPPGTGKTTVIAASVLSIIKYGSRKRTIWLVAQSNVAVKNIAEKLDKVDFREFKLLVSKDFHFDWHEHLYERLEHCVIRTDQFDKDPVGASGRLLNTRVILCTLGMLSNSRINACIDLVPLQTIIFDEASQIEVGDYLPVLHRFKDSLRKMVFIGDDKQLAPYGQDDVPQLRNRMPVIIGDFISRNVYDHKLKTVHNITSRTACRFLDVKGGQEKKSGVSWMNEREIAAITKLAQLYVNQGKQYKIITPYDAQRNAIERQLKSEELPWEDSIGNEEDHIIVSLVRSRGVGFLKNVRRTNVMLTRCKKSMIICTTYDFVTTGDAADTLVGKLATAMGPTAWLTLSTRAIERG